MKNINELIKDLYRLVKGGNATQCGLVKTLNDEELNFDIIQRKYGWDGDLYILNERNNKVYFVDGITKSITEEKNIKYLSHLIQQKALVSGNDHVCCPKKNEQDIIASVTHRSRIYVSDNQNWKSHLSFEANNVLRKMVQEYQRLQKEEPKKYQEMFSLWIGGLILALINDDEKYSQGTLYPEEKFIEIREKYREPSCIPTVKVIHLFAPPPEEPDTVGCMYAIGNEALSNLPRFFNRDILQRKNKFSEQPFFPLLAKNLDKLDEVLGYFEDKKSKLQPSFFNDTQRSQYYAQIQDIIVPSCQKLLSLLNHLCEKNKHHEFDVIKNIIPRLTENFTINEKEKIDIPQLQQKMLLSKDIIEQAKNEIDTHAPNKNFIVSLLQGFADFIKTCLHYLTLKWADKTTHWTKQDVEAKKEITQQLGQLNADVSMLERSLDGLVYEDEDELDVQDVGGQLAI